MDGDDDLVPISALQHYVFCPRQCGLIHLEQAWSENVLTAEGRLLHERVDGGETTRRGATRTVRSVDLVCRRLGIVGRADTVEITDGDDGTITVVPVEYKRGRRTPHQADRVQLCAQALCLEEMLDVAVMAGELFRGEERRRETVSMDADLRAKTEAAVRGTRAMLASGRLPPPEPGPKCRRCSLVDVCDPKLPSRHRSAAGWLDRVLATPGE